MEPVAAELMGEQVVQEPQEMLVVLVVSQDLTRYLQEVLKTTVLDWIQQAQVVLTTHQV